MKPARKKRRKHTGLKATLLSLLALLVFTTIMLWCFPEVVYRFWYPFPVHEAAYNTSLTPIELHSVTPSAASSGTDTASIERAQETLDAAVKTFVDAGFEDIFEAEGVYIVDEDGNVIFSKNETEMLYPASTTKLMTALVVVENVPDLDEMVEIGELTGCYEDGSVLMYLDEGDSMTYRDLLYAMLMHSYNDAATALAMAAGGDLDTFASMMNAKAEALGLVNSHFVNPHGLFNEEHYTCAKDLNTILQAAYAQPLIAEILTCKECTVLLHGASGNDYDVDLENTSSFLNGTYSIPGFEYMGGKTGYIMKARSCVATVFEHEGKLYYSTVLKALDASYMTTLLFDYQYDPYAAADLLRTEPVMKAWQLDNEGIETSESDAGEP